MSLTYQRLKDYSLAYLALPLLTFLCGYLRWYIALPSAACLIFGFFCARRENTEPCFTREITLGRTQLVLLALVILLWTWLGGLNGLFFQSTDWPWRNAIYHDLVEKSWPVVYPELDASLSYYIAFWLPPALPAKLTLLLSGSADLAWRVAQGALWLWSCAGLYLIALTLMFFTGAKTPGRQWAVVFIFIFFSGMDIVAWAYDGRLSYVFSPHGLHMEWVTFEGWQYSSLTTCLYWVFNQTIIPWLATACFLMEKDARNYLFLGLTCLCCGPLPFIGLVICMLARFFCSVLAGLRSGRALPLVKSALSPSNVAFLGLILPILGLYYLNNASLSATLPQYDSVSLLESIDLYLSKRLISFLLLDAGFFCALLWRRHFRNPLFYVISISLVLIPYFRIGTAQDFCMRGSIPALFILMCYCSEFLTNELPRFRQHGRFQKLLLAGLTLAILLGSATPLTEMTRGIYNVISQGTIFLAKDPFGSISRAESTGNFISANYEETFFFRRLARTPSE